VDYTGVTLVAMAGQASHPKRQGCDFQGYIFIVKLKIIPDLIF
jgi:hypothetical protein